MDSAAGTPIKGRMSTSEGLTPDYQRSAVSSSFSRCLIGDSTWGPPSAFNVSCVHLGLFYGRGGGTPALDDRSGCVAFSC